MFKPVFCRLYQFFHVSTGPFTSNSHRKWRSDFQSNRPTFQSQRRILESFNTNQDHGSGQNSVVYNFLSFKEPKNQPYTVGICVPNIPNWAFLPTLDQSFCDNIFVKSTPIVSFAQRGINTFDEINKVLVCNV